MAAAKYDLVVEQGAEFSLSVTWQNPDGTAVDLTGYRIRMQAREHIDSPDTLFSYDSAALATGQHIGALDATGVITVTFDDEVTTALDFESGVYDLTAESSGGSVHRVLTGKVRFLRAVTR